MVTHTFPHKTLQKIKCTSEITRLTGHFTFGLMSNLVIYKHRKEYGYTWHGMPALRPATGVIEKPKTRNILSVVWWIKATHSTIWDEKKRIIIDANGTIDWLYINVFHFNEWYQNSRYIVWLNKTLVWERKFQSLFRRQQGNQTNHHVSAYIIYFSKCTRSSVMT